MELHPVICSLVSIFCLLFHGTISMTTRIVGGSEVDINQVPFMLSLRLDGAHICGAAIISKNWGLTAAHCVTSYALKSESFSVRSGSSFKNSGGRVHKITRIISHESYDDRKTDFDIAVFKVKTPFRYSKNRRAIDLPGKGNVDDDWAVVAGWGYYVLFNNTLGNVLSEHLRYAFVPKVDRSSCSYDYEGRYDVTPHQVCYGYKEGGKDACKGDSGGPLFTTTSVMIGITSWGAECGDAKSPGVYTTIFLMLDWIYDKTGVKSRL